MTAAATSVWLPAVSSVDQSLQEVWTVDDLLVKFSAIIRDFRGLVKLGKTVPVLAKLGFATAQARPHEIASAHEAWTVAEAIEPYFFEVFARLSGPAPGASGASASHEASLTAMVGKELASRLSYLQTLTQQLHERLGQPRTGGSQHALRENGQAIINDLAVPPEIRLLVHQGRLVPVLIFLVGSLEQARRRGVDASRLKTLYLEALREGLDLKISFLLALLQPSPPEPPAELSGVLPEPMPLEALDTRWRGVQDSFASR